MIFDQLIKDLVPTSPWIESFGYPLKDVMSDVRNAALKSGEWIKYDPARFVDWLPAASRLLDRCLAYRREYMELSGAATGFALDELNYILSAKNLEKIEAAAWNVKLRIREAREQMEVKSVYDQHPGDLSKGLSRSAEAAYRIACEGIRQELVRYRAVQEKWRNLNQHHSRLIKQHELPGHPLHFVERAEKVKSLMMEDFTEALSKARAAREGLLWTFGLELDEWPSLEGDALDAAVTWARDAIMKLEIERSLYFETTVPVSVRRSLEGSIRSKDFLPDYLKGKVTTDKSFSEIVSLPSQHIVLCSDVRENDILITVGASFCVSDPGGFRAPNLVNGIVYLRAPGYYDSGKDTHSSDWPRKRPWIKLNTVGLERPRSLDDWTDPAIVQNTPAYGVWDVIIGWHDNANRADWSRAGLSDVLLWMRVLRKRDTRRDMGDSPR